MASRIMHYVIADLLSKKIDIKDYNRFVFGALLPDMSSHEDGSYVIAHMGGSNEAKGIKGIDWSKFYNKYQSNMLEDDLYLGYYVHLIVDAYWLKHIQNKFVRKHSKEVKHVLRKKGYREMQSYNSLLVDKFNLVNKIEVIRNMRIDEINEAYIDLFMRAFGEDFVDEKNGDVLFEVYPYEDVMLFIQNACEKCICEINAARSKHGMGNSEDYYVEI